MLKSYQEEEIEYELTEALFFASIGLLTILFLALILF